MKKSCRVFTQEEFNMVREMAVLKTEVAWIKRLLFLILGIALANLGALVFRVNP